MGKRKLFVLAVVVAVFAAPAIAGAVTGFTGPLFALDTAPNGDLLVADAGAGIIGVDDDEIESAISLPGITGVSAIGRNSMWAVTRAEPPPEGPTMDTGQALWRVSNGKSRMIVNLFDVEEELDPDGNVDSNPFDVQSLGGNAALVVDAGGNDLLHVDNRGNVELLAVFPTRLATCPAPFCGPDVQLPTQSVPTSVAVGPDGWYYVGELRGFPGPIGESSIWKVAPDASEAQCGVSPDCVEVFQGGFTSIIDLAFGPDGNLYVAELDEASWTAVEIFRSPTGGTINSCDLLTLSCDEVATDIIELTAITFGKDGSLWATRNAVFTPEPAEVFRVS
jgi:hypothetical protein